jgi:hypothetical protein
VGAFPTVDESRDRLHRAGWSVGEIATAACWVVSGTNGQNLLRAEGAGQAEAWWRACEPARAVGDAGAASNFSRQYLGFSLTGDSQAPYNGVALLPCRGRITRK